MKSYDKLSKEEKLEIVEVYQKGNFIKDIPNMLNVSARSVSRVLKENNIYTFKKNRYALNESYFGEINSEEKAYVLGMLYADGYVGDEKFNNIILSLKKEDEKLIYKIADLIGYTGNIRYEEKETNYGLAKRFILNFSSKQMASDLRTLGLYPGKSSTMTKLPNIPKNLIRHFIRGYYDGDGSMCISIKKQDRMTKSGMKHYESTTAKIDIVATIDFGNELLNYLPNGFKIKPIKSKNMCYVTVHNNKLAIEFLEYIYNDNNICMDRKFNKYIEFIGALDKKLSS